MDFRKKLSYFKTYYLLKTVIIIIAVVSVISIVSNIREAKKEKQISGMMVNTMVNSEGSKTLTDGFSSYCGTRKKSELSEGIYITFDEQGVIKDSQYKMMVTAQVSTGSVDYMIVDADTLHWMITEGACEQLPSLLSEETLEKVQDRMEGDTAIRLAGTEFAEKSGLVPDDAYLIFIVTGKHKAMAEKMTEYIFQ